MNDPVSINPAALQHGDIRAQVGTPKNLLLLCADKNALLVQPEFGDFRTPKDLEYIDKIFNHVLDHTIEYLHNLNQETLYITPFMIGMTYLHRLVYGEREENLVLSDDTFGNLVLAPKTSELIERLKKDHLINNGPLSGTIFITDKKAIQTEYFTTLREEGARCIGIEAKVSEFFDIRQYMNSTYLVAKKFVVFAINEGDKTLYKQCAQYHNIYTVTFFTGDAYLEVLIQVSTLEKPSICDLTVTARSYDDVKSVAAAMGRVTNVVTADKMAVCEQTPVVISLGWTSYEQDLILHNLANKLNDEGHPITYYFFHNVMDSKYVLQLLSSRENWEKTVGKGPEGNQKLDIDKVPDWAFVICYIGYVTFEAISVVSGYSGDITLSLPNHDNVSIQIIRSIASAQTIFDFCESIVKDYLPTL